MVLLAQVQADVSDRTSLFGTLCCTCVHCQRSHYINVLLSSQELLYRCHHASMSGTICILLHPALMLRTPVKTNVNTLLSISTHRCIPKVNFLNNSFSTPPEWFYQPRSKANDLRTLVSISNRPCGLLDKLPRRTAPILVPGVAILPRKIRKKA
jgi:hypothetical protein